MGIVPRSHRSSLVLVPWEKQDLKLKIPIVVRLLRKQYIHAYTQLDTTLPHYTLESRTVKIIGLESRKSTSTSSIINHHLLLTQAWHLRSKRYQKQMADTEGYSIRYSIRLLHCGSRCTVHNSHRCRRFVYCICVFACTLQREVTETPYWLTNGRRKIQDFEEQLGSGLFAIATTSCFRHTGIDVQT